ncbi:MAG: carboxylesterase/lipase family protein, partial [Janthinobacterium lividum]
VFLGIPFARPPVGSLRFCPPEPPVAWTAVRDCKRYAPAAIQPGANNVAQSEDCLYLNVWAPEQSNASSTGYLPVFIWIHGGGFTGGRTSEPQFAGSHFAHSGVVCITIAYRLGALGFLDVSPMLGSEYVGSANNGLRDLIAALEWVQRNVAALGGDPRRVTIGGESAGAKLTDLLLGIPAAAPLFHQAISESGGAERIATTSSSGEVGRGFADVWTRQTSQPVSALRTAPAQQLIEVQTQFLRSWPMHFPLRPELDHRLASQAPLAAITSGLARGKRLLLGTNRDESALFLGPHPKGPAKASDLGNLPLYRFQPLAAHYASLYPELTEEQRLIRSVTAEEYWIPSLRVAEAMLAGGGEAYVYRLDFPGTGRFSGLAFHSYDLRFVWDSFGAEPPAPEQQQLGVQMHAAWVAFLAGQTPGAAGLPVWPRYSLDSRPTMLFDQPSQIAWDPGRAERKLWDGLLV